MSVQIFFEKKSFGENCHSSNISQRKLFLSKLHNNQNCQLVNSMSVDITGQMKSVKKCQNYNSFGAKFSHKTCTKMKKKTFLGIKFQDDGLCYYRNAF